MNDITERCIESEFLTHLFFLVIHIFNDNCLQICAPWCSQLGSQSSSATTFDQRLCGASEMDFWRRHVKGKLYSISVISKI